MPPSHYALSRCVSDPVSVVGKPRDERLTTRCPDAARVGRVLAVAASGVVSRYGNRTAAERHRRCDTDDRRKSMGGEEDGLRRGDWVTDPRAWSHRTDGVGRQSYRLRSADGRGNGE